MLTPLCSGGILRRTEPSCGRTKIYSGIGFDVPGSPADDPETIYQATLNAFAAARTASSSRASTKR
jgi:hypothetical protein